MRIALIAPPWLPVPPPAYGGTELVIHNLACGLSAVGHDVVLFATGDSTCPVQREFVYPRAEGIRPGPLAELHHVLSAYEALHDVDVVHDHTIIGPVYAALRPDLAVVTTNHGPFDDALIAVYREASRRVPVLAISRAQAESAGELPIARVIHHGIDVSQMPFGSGADGPCVFLGRMGPDKGAHRAARIARAAGVPLLIAAKMREPGEHRYFEESVVPLLGDGIEYVGEVDQQHKLSFLADARALINPICWPEPFGLVMVEALACGTPVLAFPAGAAPEIVADGRTGFLCANEHEMVRRIHEVDRLDRQACRSEVEQRFSVERMVAEHLEVYAEVGGRDRLAA
jgi:glycosyltransferase involved in cell wall biosynthesis